MELWSLASCIAGQAPPWSPQCLMRVIKRGLGQRHAVVRSAALPYLPSAFHGKF